MRKHAWCGFPYVLIGYMRIFTNGSYQVASWHTMQAVLYTNVFVSGLSDHHMLALEARQGIRIITPAEAVALMAT